MTDVLLKSRKNKGDGKADKGSYLSYLRHLLSCLRLYDTHPQFYGSGRFLP